MKRPPIGDETNDLIKADDVLTATVLTANETFSHPPVLFERPAVP